MVVRDNFKNIVLAMWVGLGTRANQVNRFCELTDDNRVAGPTVQIHANYMLNIGLETILKFQVFCVVGGTHTN
jgi:hypothetical protein